MPETNNNSSISYEQFKEQEAILGDEAVIAYCEAAFNRNLQFMAKKRTRASKNERLYYGDMDIPNTKAKVQINLVLPIVKQQEAVISDFFPSTDIVPKNKMRAIHKTFADILQQRKDEVEEDDNMLARDMETIENSLIQMSGMERVLPRFKVVEVKDPDTGKVTEEEVFDGLDIDNIDFMTWLPSSDATSMDIKKDATDHIFVTPMSPEKVMHIWGKVVEPEGDINEWRSFNKRRSGGENDEGDKGSIVLVKERYFMDYELDKNGKLKYPNGRHVVWGNKEMLNGVEDEETDPDTGEVTRERNDPQVLEFPRIPYFHLGNYSTSQNMFGIGEPELVRMIVLAISHMTSSILDNINLTGNPEKYVTQLLYNELEGEVFGRPEGVIQVMKGRDDVGYIDPPRLQSAPQQMINMLMVMLREVSGIWDVQQGKAPGGVTAASAIAILQEASQSRIREKISNNISNFLIEKAEFVIWILQEYDDAVIGFQKGDETDQFGNPQFREFDPTAQHVLDQNGEIKPAEEGKDGESIKDAEFKIKAVTGQRRRTGRLAEAEIAKQDFKNGIFSIEELVKRSDYSDKQTVIDNWYKMQGLQGLAQHQEDLAKATEEFEQLIVKMMEQDPESGEIQGLSDVDQFKLTQLLEQYPELVQTEMWNKLPPDIQLDLLIVLTTPGVDEQQPPDEGEGEQ